MMKADVTVPRVLLADGQADVVSSLRILLKSEGFTADAVTSPAAVLSSIEQRDYDVVLMDLDYSRDKAGSNGGDLLRALVAVDPHLSIVVMADHAPGGAAEAVERGARDYVEKPWDDARLLGTLRTQVELTRALRRGQRLESENLRLRVDGIPPIVAESRMMRRVLDLAERVAPSDVNILITGEHGSGKSVLARTLHARSLRADRPLVTLNAGGLSDDVFESELFGHVRGVTHGTGPDHMGCFETAHGGTVFLDEIGNMPPGQQAKLLRVLQTGELQRLGSNKTRRVDVRLLTASNTDLHDAVSEGRFREDLLYRLNTVEVALPPLRDRAEDIPTLARTFLGEQALRYEKPVREFSPEAELMLVRHPWPGNVRELEHAVERAVLLAEGEQVAVADLGLTAPAGGLSQLETMTLNAAEKVLIQKALRRCEGNVTRAAGVLGVSRSALYRRLQRHGI